METVSNVVEQERAGPSFYSAIAKYEKGTPQSSRSLDEVLGVIG